MAHRCKYRFFPLALSAMDRGICVSDKPISDTTNDIFIFIESF
ncbi:hypothetical protein C4J94_4046 [Pseudomonas sp. R5-89-07]|nr:hypothetical protein C4J94_4046 [Pseudomonas sp. R5-89-07]